MNGQTVAILESRLGTQVADLITRRGGKPLHAPALAEEPAVDPEQIRALIDEWRGHPVKAAIFQTGVGTRALFQAADELGLTPTLLTLLAATNVIVRGPKPTGALRSRNVRIDLSAAEPYTTHEVLLETDTLELAGERVVVQRYGARNVELEQGLQKRGAEVIEIPTYRWAMPRDTAPLAQLLRSLDEHSVHAIVFTSASQVSNLFAFVKQKDAARDLAAQLSEIVVASVGPVCSAALKQHDVRISLEASPPKLGPLLDALDAALQ